MNAGKSITEDTRAAIAEQVSKGKPQMPYRLRAMARTARKIADHFKRLNTAKASGTPVRFRTLKEKTGLKFGSGIGRGYRRAHARLVFSILKKQGKR